MKKSVPYIPLLALSIILLIGCTPPSTTGAPTETSTVEPTATHMPTPIPTVTPTPTVTPVPTYTQIPNEPSANPTAPSTVHINFVDSGQILGNGSSFAVSLGDLDGDGDLDSVVANRESSRVWLNDGSAAFTDSGQDLGFVNGLDVGDLDQDGDVDIFSAGESVRVWFNDGNAGFSPTQTIGKECFGVSLGDLDADGDLDAMIARMGEPNEVWINDGQGTFAIQQRLGGSRIIYDYSMDFRLADLDGDGDLDAFEVNYNGYHRLWINDGSGTFSMSEQDLYAGDHSHGVALGDLNSDGDLDVFVSLASRMAFRVLLNGGKGILTDSGQGLPSSNAQAVSLGDLDGDGDLDAFMAHSGTSEAGYGNTVWLNDGTGTFSDSGLRLRHAYSLGVALGDLDGDGDLDAFIANAFFENPLVDKSNRVWLNQTSP